MHQKTDSKNLQKNLREIRKKFLSGVAFQIDFLLSIAQMFGYYNAFGVLRL